MALGEEGHDFHHGGVGGDRHDIGAGGHDALGRGRGPLRTGNAGEVVDGEEANDVVVVGDDDGALAPADHVLVDDGLDGGAGLDLDEGAVHQVAGGEAVEHGVQADVVRLGAGGAEQEPADHDRPDAEGPLAHEQEDDAQGDESPGEHLAGAGGDTGGLAEAARALPGDGAQDASAVEGEAGEDVEHGEDDVDEGEVLQHRSQGRGAAAGEPGEAEDDEGEGEAGGGSGGGDEELLAGGTGLAREVGDAAEDEQRDAGHGQPATDGDHRMGELVQEHGHEHEHGGHDSEQPVARDASLEALGEEAVREQEGDNPQDEEPGGVNLDDDATDRGDSQTARGHASTVGHGSSRRHDRGGASRLRQRAGGR